MDTDKPFVHHRPAPEDQRDVKGRFAPGHRGGPGRKKGTPTSSKKAEYMRLMETHTPEILMTVINKAKAGDLTAAKLILNRVVPELSAMSSKLQEEIDSLRDQIATVASNRLN